MPRVVEGFHPSKSHPGARLYHQSWHPDFDDAATPPVSAEDAESALKASAKRAEIEALQAYRFMRAPAMPEEDALRLIQRNERGRQGRARSFAMAETRREQELADAALLNKRSEAEVAVICQALIRGFLTRRRVRRLRDEELQFLGMKLPERLERLTLAEEAKLDAQNEDAVSVPSNRRAMELRDANNASARRANKSDARHWKIFTERRRTSQCTLPRLFRG